MKNGPPLTIVGNSLGGWIAWLLAQECQEVERLVLIAPAFNMMGLRARSIDPERCHDWHSGGWMPWDDDPLHKEWPLSWKWVEESEAYWKTSFDRLRPVSTAILHGQQDDGDSANRQQPVCRTATIPGSLVTRPTPSDSRRPSTEQSRTFESVSQLVQEELMLTLIHKECGGPALDESPVGEVFASPSIAFPSPALPALAPSYSRKASYRAWIIKYKYALMTILRCYRE